MVFSNSLNLRIANRVSQIAQGDNASTIILELLDQDNLPVLSIDNGKLAQINLLKDTMEVVYQVNAPVYDSRVEFDIQGILEPGIYIVEVRLNYEGSIYIFPSDVKYRISIAKSSDFYWSTMVEKTDIQQVGDYILSILPQDYVGHVASRDNPHEVTKDQVGLGNVLDVEQASKEDFDAHKDNAEIHVTQANKDTWDSNIRALATKAQAEAGTDNSAIMTPLRVRDAMAMFGLGRFAKALASNADANDVKLTGTYHGTGNANLPVTSLGILVVELVDANNGLQEFYVISTKEKYVRYIANGTWGAWSVTAELRATKAEAEAGTGNATAMTPLRVRESMAMFGLGGPSKSLPNGTDLDSVKTNGGYYGNQLINAPSSTSILFKVALGSSNYGYQEAIDVGSGRSFSRNLIAGVWSPWTQIHLPVATKAQAEAGTDNATVMTPARTKDAILALAPSGGGSSDPLSPGKLMLKVAGQESVGYFKDGVLHLNIYVAGPTTMGQNIPLLTFPADILSGSSYTKMRQALVAPSASLTVLEGVTGKPPVLAIPVAKFDGSDNTVTLQVYGALAEGQSGVASLAIPMEGYN